VANKKERVLDVELQGAMDRKISMACGFRHRRLELTLERRMP
jgi:hypothetical protein